MKTSTLISAFALSLSTAACGSVESTSADQPDAGMPTPDEPDAPDEPTPDAPPAPLAGTVDTTYGTNGVVLVDAVTGYANDVAVQGDKLIVCSTANDNGTLHGTLTRIGLDGVADETFGLQDGKISIGDGSSCRRVAVRPDGTIVAYFTYTSGPRALFRLDRDGQSFNSDLSTSSLRGMNLEGSTLLAAYSASPIGQTARDAEHPADTATNGNLAGTPIKPFSIGGKHVLVGTFTKDAATGWGVVREEAEGSLGMPAVVISADTSTPDFMYDAVALPDGSILAVGSADQDRDSLLAHFPMTGPPTAAIQKLGLTSASRRVILDGAGRPIVLGSASVNGQTQLTWQRLTGSGVSVDPTYAGGGTVITPAPHGSGEVVGAVRHGGAIYLLASYDVEQPVMKTALLKIAE